MVTVPLCAVTRCLTTASPIPRPPCACLRAEADWANIPNTCGSNDAGIPDPLSLTVMTSSAGDSLRVGPSLSSGASTVREMSPPTGVYFTALDNRLQTTCVRAHEVRMDGHRIRWNRDMQFMLAGV